jgi:hypothetical protein
MHGKGALVIAQPTKAKLEGPASAWQLYQGSQQQLVRAGLRAVWDRFGFRRGIDEVILSPLHGPLVADALVGPYDYTWRGRPPAEVAAHVANTSVIERLQMAVAGHDLVLVLLSKTYLRPLRLREWVPATAPQRWLFLVSGEGLPFAPAGTNVRFIAAGMAEARRERVKALDLKAHLFRNICLQVAERGPSALETAWEAAAPSM